MPAALSYNLCPSLLIPQPLSKCENSEAIAKKMSTPDPRGVQAGAGLVGIQQDIKLTAPLEWPRSLHSSLKICLQPRKQIEGPCKE